MSTKKIKYGSKDLARDFGALSFGGLLKAHREGEGWSQEHMGAKLNMKRQAVCDLEKGRKIPSPERAASIAKKLRLSIPLCVQLSVQDALDSADLRLTIHIGPKTA
jgi:DNA-binding XRE family transcriptional regulator